MLSEFQSYPVGCCAGCGATALRCEDWPRLEWDGGDPECVHSLDAADFESGLNPLLARINKTGSFLKAIRGER